MKILVSLIKKEMLQIFRDPSALLIAFILPLILLFIFGYGVSLDSNKIKVGLVLEKTTPDILALAEDLRQSRYFETSIGKDRREFVDDLLAGRLRGIVVIPQDFPKDLALEGRSADIQILTDGSEPNIAFFVQNYVQAIVQNWQQKRSYRQGILSPEELINLQSRFWYNPELKSRNFLIPGSISIIMTLIGTLLTALVVAREWERGTMEALMATPVTIWQILLGKLIPYYILGIGSMLICIGIATLYYDVPFRGSLWALFLITSIFLVTGLGQGLLISTLAKDQFVASQGALLSAFLPAFMLSGFVFEISSMPTPVEGLSYAFAARYYVTCLQTLFLVGDVWPLFLRCMGAMLVIGAVFTVLILQKTVKRLDA